MSMRRRGCSRAGTSSPATTTTAARRTPSSTTRTSTRRARRPSAFRFTATAAARFRRGRHRPACRTGSISSTRCRCIPRPRGGSRRSSTASSSAKTATPDPNLIADLANTYLQNGTVIKPVLQRALHVTPVSGSVDLLHPLRLAGGVRGAGGQGNGVERVFGRNGVVAAHEHGAGAARAAERRRLGPGADVVFHRRHARPHEFRHRRSPPIRNSIWRRPRRRRAAARVRSSTT